MAAKTTLNAKNLETLGAERLAALVMEVADGDAARKRIARAALLEAAGGSALAAAVSKRLISLRRAQSWIDYKKRRAFLDDLDRQRELIAVQIAKDAPREALDLMWRFMALADPVYNRIDDSSGAVGEIFQQACEDLAHIVAKAKPKPETLADQVFQAVTEANGFGEFDDLIEGVAPTLGKDGLARLRMLLQEARKKEAEETKDGDRGRVIGYGSGGPLYEADLRRSHVTSAAHLGLLSIADALGDVDAYIAEHPGEQRQNTVFAARIAERLVAAGRAEEALDFLDGSTPSRDFGRREWVEARLLTLEALGRDGEAQSLRWDAFVQALDPDMLRAHLKRLPDFEDDEAEERALALVASNDDIHTAMRFLIQWPAHRRAAALIRDRRDVLDGNLYFILGPAAEALETTEPLAAMLLLRPMIEYTLDRAKSSRYRHAARHMQTCEFLAGVVEAWDGVETHDAFIARLRKSHPRKAQFWHLASGEA